MAFKQLLGPVSTLTCHLPRQVVRAMHSTAPLLLPPDLYEGSREDRNPYPSSAEGITKENSTDPQDKDLPPGAYPLRGDPAAQQQHPGKQELPNKTPADPGPTPKSKPDKPYPENRPDYDLYSDPKASAVKGVPDSP